MGATLDKVTIPEKLKPRDLRVNIQERKADAKFLGCY
jgi:hypothetical protein